MDIKRKIKLALAAVGPGLFLIGYNIGTGSVTTMAKAGAEYGMSLFWAVVLSALFTYVLMVAYGKLTIVSGKTALANIKHEFGKIGKPLALYIFIALVIGEVMALMGVMGIVVDLIKEGIYIIDPTFGSDNIGIWITLFITTILYALIWKGSYKSFEKVLTIFVIIMALSFIVVFILVKPDFSEILNGLIPSIPSNGAMKIIAAMAGTTCSAAVFIMRSTVVAEKGWSLKDLKIERKDSAVSAIMMLFLSGVIMAVSAGTLKVMGLQLNETKEMISMFEPIGGKAAAFLLIFGIVGAGISTVFPIVLIAPWLLSDYNEKPRDIKSPLYRTLTFVALIFAFGMQFMDERPVAVMIISQAFQTLILPAVVIPAFILLNRKSFIGEYKAKLKENIGIMAVIIFSLVTAYFSLAEML